MDLAASGRYYALHKSLRNVIKCLPGACSREFIKDAFPSFTDEERERLYRMLHNVMRSMHDNILDEFDEVCQQQQVSVALDKIDEFVIKRNLDQLSSTDETSIDAIEEKTSRMKKDKIAYLADILKKVEESNNAMEAQIKLMKIEEDSTVARALLNKMTKRHSACLKNSDI
ncbi:hypothetical protein QOZ80_8AG0618510 [Eleusine coracana subsp. coracana]|nr:hypothetical protein QOZ80_8AG0618510 [Eleusine coracana subsp. coracana]